VSANASGIAAHPLIHVALLVLVVGVALAVFFVIRRRRS
jgi:hypothetical protein